MGIRCPECGKHAAQTSAITANGLPPKTADDIIGYVLACGHEVCNADYAEYRKELAVIEGNEAQEIRKIKDVYKLKKTALWQAKVQKKESAK